MTPHSLRITEAPLESSRFVFFSLTCDRCNTEFDRYHADLYQEDQYDRTVALMDKLMREVELEDNCDEYVVKDILQE